MFIGISDGMINGLDDDRHRIKNFFFFSMYLFVSFDFIIGYSYVQNHCDALILMFDIVFWFSSSEYRV